MGDFQGQERDHQSKIDQFMSMAGVDDVFAEDLLEQTNWDLNKAINLFMGSSEEGNDDDSQGEDEIVEQGGGDAAGAGGSQMQALSTGLGRSEAYGGITPQSWQTSYLSGNDSNSNSNSSNGGHFLANSQVPSNSSGMGTEQEQEEEDDAKIRAIASEQGVDRDTAAAIAQAEAEINNHGGSSNNSSSNNSSNNSSSNSNTYGSNNEDMCENVSGTGGVRAPIERTRGRLFDSGGGRGGSHIHGITGSFMGSMMMNPGGMHFTGGQFGGAGATGATGGAGGVGFPTPQAEVPLRNFAQEGSNLEASLTGERGGNLDAETFQQFLQGATSQTFDPQQNQLFTQMSAPREVMFHGSFERAREEARSTNKNILVNIQQQDEFRSLELNRDVWSSEVISSMLTSSFIFWQRDRSHPEAQHYINLYQPEDPFPHVAIIDPHTGELLKTIKLPKSSSEDLFSCVLEQLTSFFDEVEKQQSERNRLREQAQAEVGPMEGEQSVPASYSSSSPASMVADTDNNDACGSSSKNGKSSSGNSSNSGGSGSGSSSTESPSDTSTKSKKVARRYATLRPEPSSEEDDAVQVAIRLFSGRVAKRRFLGSWPVEQLFSFVESEAESDSNSSSNEACDGKPFDLITTFPQRSFSDKLHVPIRDAGLKNTLVIAKWTDN